MMKDEMNIKEHQIAELLKPKITTRKQKRLQKLKAPKGKISFIESVEKKVTCSDENDDPEGKFE